MTTASVHLEETTDGELFFEIPDDLLDTLGWGDGTVLQWDVIGDSIRISRAPDEAVGEDLLPEQSRVVRNVETVERGYDGVDEGDDGVVGEPSY